MSMRKPHGNFLCVDPDPASWQVGTAEFDIFVCQHCTAPKRVPAGKLPTEEYIDPLSGRKEQGFTCKCCGDNEYICKACKARGGCMPIDVTCALIEGPIRKLEARIKEDSQSRNFLRDVFGVS